MGDGKVSKVAESATLRTHAIHACSCMPPCLNETTLLTNLRICMGLVEKLITYLIYFVLCPTEHQMGEFAAALGS